jgi:splicing factor 3A subunit 1
MRIHHSRDVIRLTAMFVAKNGRQFMTALAQREQRNAQFDFLRPNHTLFGYFSSLVGQYGRVIHQDHRLMAKLSQDANNRYSVRQGLLTML